MAAAGAARGVHPAALAPPRAPPRPRPLALTSPQVPREEEFAPVKNAPGSSSDSPDTARALYSQLSRRRLLAAGATVSGDESALVELSPLVSYQGEGLEAYADKAIQAPIHLEK